jgi:hypothetical protein
MRQLTVARLLSRATSYFHLSPAAYSTFFHSFRFLPVFSYIIGKFKMSLIAMPILVANFGGEMLYIIQQRLEAQNVAPQKSMRGILTNLSYFTDFVPTSIPFFSSSGGHWDSVPGTVYRRTFHSPAAFFIPHPHPSPSWKACAFFYYAVERIEHG